MKKRAIKNSVRIVVVSIIVFLCGCQENYRQKQERFLTDNQSLDFLRWEGWYVHDRSSYYLMQIHKDEKIICHLIFWKEKQHNNAILIRSPYLESSFSTLGDLPNEPGWSRHCRGIKYLDVYDMIQLVYNYQLQEVKIRDNNVSVIIDNQPFIVSSNKR